MSQANDEKIDLAMQAAWSALESGDIAGARAAVQALSGESSAATEVLMLESACDREDGDSESALRRLEAAAKAEPEWGTPELWMAEVLADMPDRQAEALKHAGRAVALADEEDELLAALACKAALELELGRPADARKTLKDLPSAEVPMEDPGTALEFVQLLLEADNPTEARARLDVLTATQPDLADPWYLRGVLADMEGDDVGRTAAWVKTRELDLRDLDEDAHGHTHDGDCLHLTEAELMSVADETLASIPGDIRERMREVPVIVADLPAAADVDGGTDPRSLGLFHGATDGDRGTNPALTEIVLFRKNIERVAHDAESLKEEVRTTLLHEAGHFFGLDEAAMMRLEDPR